MTDLSTEMAETSPLMAFVVALLSSLMSPSLTDQRLARLAAREALGAHRTSAHPTSAQGELVTIAQIVGFALAALDTLRLSMPEALSLSMKLKLRGNANALNRSARDCTHILHKARPDPATPAPDPAIQTTPTPTPIPKPAPQPLTGGEWGNAMKTVAARLLSDSAIVSPAQRQTDALWIEALTGVAGELARAKNHTDSPAMGRAGLLRSTVMASDPGLPAHLFIGAKRKRA